MLMMMAETRREIRIEIGISDTRLNPSTALIGTHTILLRIEPYV
jgi:hypothetical protein